ncbi:family 20 glycosylhydrolase [Photobacterium halotolerans]|uniref:beta-N-acetylhexosaminidase n=1 Tax=Photobacterium halotolerans TaxID=265726 RepID=A0A7X4W7K4_9GAMM|nr:family 20 glycosylhydrolase [Photobacterium halotolerans]NAW63654.1 family 20 glycosylhydrolase [Photobacterium halotolerans]NAW84954.1 family 20 glycosylhydrolase [Photobacterium halotolerans]NAX47157.1 family 20 glycosylhydrolase [Photobacterium halotolerans]
MIKTSVLALALSAVLTAPAMAIPAADLDQLGQGLNVTYTVLDNTQDDWVTFRAKIDFTNQSGKTLPATGWSIYFSHIRMVENVLSDQVTISHVNGDMFKIEPTANFVPLAPGQSLAIEFDAANWQVAKTDVMPNWYFVSEDQGQTITSLITSTSNRVNGQVPTKPSEELPFVADFSTPQQWKRYGSAAITDFYDPFTAQDRYQRNADLNVINNASGVIPTPAELTLGTGDVTLDSTWVIVYGNGYEDQAMFLAEQLGVTAVPWSPTTQKRINMGWSQVNINGEQKWEEAYNLNVDAANEIITIGAADAAGALYASQSLLQLVDGNKVPEVQITDAPRFAYRGFSVDAVRNFRTKEAIIQLLDQMAAFKLNKLHLRLADDEGWRIEIPGLPELTEVGATRCHDPEEKACILPFLGAGPDGSPESNGYYTAADYQDILSHAAALNIEVVPEIDIPGHAHAAIKAMEARYDHYAAQGNMAEANKYLLTDFNDTTQYLSVQMFTDNAINVCMESSYNFVDAVVNGLVSLHQGVQPLKTFHFGGDEIAGAWINSPACQDFIANNTDGVNSVSDLSRYFVERISVITANYGLDMAGWEDGLMHDGQVYPRSQMANSQLWGNAWQNIWEWGVADRAYNLANNDYKVVYNHASHLYFDHPYEPDPNERGYYWAPRFTDTRKTFGFMPDDVFANADFTRAGAPITKAEVVASAGVKKLLKPENVLGLQGSLWAETVRTEDQFEGMIFPRVLGLAERAWHTAAWEANDNAGIALDEAGRNAGYNQFANLLGQKVLPKLEQAGIAFNLPVPGGVIENGVLQANSTFPGLTIEYSTDQGTSWQSYDHLNPPAVAAGVQLRTVSGQRTSRVTTVN